MIIEAGTPEAKELEVILDGVNVTRICAKVDTTRQTAWLYVVNDGGLILSDGIGPRKVKVAGDLLVRPKQLEYSGYKHRLDGIPAEKIREWGILEV